MRCVAVAAAAALAATGAWADPLTATAPAAGPVAVAPPPAQLIKGTVAAYDPMTRLLSIATGSKKKPVTVTVTLAENLRVLANQKRKVADIKTGEFVGVSALKSADGKLRAQRVNVLPEEMRGLGEGLYPMGDPALNRFTANATVAEVTAKAPNNGTLHLSYHGAAPDAAGVCSGHANEAGSPGCSGDAEVVVAPGIPVTGIAIGDESLIVPGAVVSVSAKPSPDGTPQATRLTVDKTG